MNKDVTEGFKNALPIMLGYTPLGIAFGAVAQTQGFNILEVFLMSLTIFSGSGQFIAVSLLASGVNFITVLITVTLINSRYFLFSMSLSQKFKNMPIYIKLLAPQGITDETYLSAIVKEENVTPSLWFSLSMFSHFAWVSATVIGSLIGSKLGPTKALGLDFALPAMFIALTVLVIKNTKDAIIGAFASLVAVILVSFNYKDIYILAATFVAATIGTVYARWKK